MLSVWMDIFMLPGNIAKFSRLTFYTANYFDKTVFLIVVEESVALSYTKILQAF